MQPIAIVCVSDTHTNSAIGLWSEKFVTASGNVIEQNKYQKWLWECWIDFCTWTQQWERRIIVHNGDPMQGINPGYDVQTLVLDESDQRLASEFVLKPLFCAPGVVAKYMVKGTEWHEGPGGKQTRELAEALGAKCRGEPLGPNDWHLPIQLDGKLFTFAHHTAGAAVYPHTPAMRIMREAKQAFVDGGMPLPDCFIRSHVHRFNVTPDETGSRLYITTPGWQLQTAYGYRIKPHSPPQIGGIVLWVEPDGEIRYKVRKYSIPAQMPIVFESSPSQSLA